MAHIGIEGFHARHGKDHRTERDKRDPRFQHKEIDAVPRIERPEDIGRYQYRARADRPDGNEPEKHDGTEQTSDLGGSVILHQEKPEQDHQCDGKD